MPVSEATFREVALQDPEGQWELVCGRLRGKPGMTAEHNSTMFELAVTLRQQLSPQDFRVRQNGGHVRRTAENYYIPDVFVIPAPAERTQCGTRQRQVDG